MDLTKDIKRGLRVKLFTKLRELSPNDRFDDAFDKWALENYGLRLRYDLPDRPSIITSIQISEEEYTLLLLKLPT
jgi:hypothetical protein